MRQFTCPKAVTHPSTNRARCRATALIETNALPLHQTANQTANLTALVTCVVVTWPAVSPVNRRTLKEPTRNSECWFAYSLIHVQQCHVAPLRTRGRLPSWAKFCNPTTGSPTPKVQPNQPNVSNQHRDRSPASRFIPAQRSAGAVFAVERCLSCCMSCYLSVTRRYCV